MGLVHAALLALGACQALGRATSGDHEKRQSVSTAKYCPGSTSVCFSEFSTPSSNIIYRIAIPDVSSAPFDILLQIVAPISTTGWAGLAWGGSMTKNPLTIGWASGTGAVVSSRWATGHTLPQPYTGASYTVLPTSKSNTTHFQLDVLCSGCSQWGTVSLNPNGANTFAWAKGGRAVTTASSNTSSFAYHDDKGVFSHDLSQAKIPKGVFDALAYDAGNTAPTPGSSTSSSAVLPTTSSSSTVVIVPTSTSLIPTVITSVTTLPPRPSTTLTFSPSSPSSSSSLTLTLSSSTTTPTTSRPTVITSVTTLPPRPSTTPTTVITTTSRPTVITSVTTLPPRPSTTTSIVWTPDQPLPTTTKSSTVVIIPPKPTTTTVVGPPWGGTGPPWGIPPFGGGRPPWRGPPWRRPPGVDGEAEVEVGQE